MLRDFVLEFSTFPITRKKYFNFLKNEGIYGADCTTSSFKLYENVNHFLKIINFFRISKLVLKMICD